MMFTRLHIARVTIIFNDITLNSFLLLPLGSACLFVCLSTTGQVEDLTGKGLSDLSFGLLRTPLPPLTTFLDDPLRVLRAIRFRCTFLHTCLPAILPINVV